jgi:hypothetical protein
MGDTGEERFLEVHGESGGFVVDGVDIEGVFNVLWFRAVRALVFFWVNHRNYYSCGNCKSKYTHSSFGIQLSNR